MKIYNVSELNIEAREAILTAFEYPVSVKGEITDYRASRGHQYFKLRNELRMHNHTEGLPFIEILPSCDDLNIIEDESIIKRAKTMSITDEVYSNNNMY